MSKTLGTTTFLIIAEYQYALRKRNGTAGTIYLSFGNPTTVEPTNSIVAIKNKNI